MIFFGTKGKAVAGKHVDGIECPSCKNNRFATFGILRYFHLYWVPTFPTSKTVGIECTHCKHTLVDKELPPELAKQIKSTVFTKKKTLPMFSGLILIGALVVFGAYAAQKDSTKETVYLQHPVVNDLYIVDVTKLFSDADHRYKYGVMRVTQLSAGQVELRVSKIAYNKPSGVRKDIRERKTSADSYYDDKPVFIDISKLKGMKDSGAIYSVISFRSDG